MKVSNFVGVADFHFPRNGVETLIAPLRKSNGQFGNPFDGWEEPGFRKILKWKTISKAPESKYSMYPSEEDVSNHMPLKKPQFSTQSTGDDMKVTWLGHSTCVLEMDGISLITDPIFSNYCAPSYVSKYIPSALTKRMRRMVGLPCTVDDLPDSLRFVLISHNHFDHLDEESCQMIEKKYGDHVIWCVPSGVKGEMEKMFNKKDNRVYEFDWWQGRAFSFDEKKPDQSYKVIATPCQHWSQRGALDRNLSLWASWVFQSSSGRKFYFGGDTGYTPDAFKQIGKVFGPFDLAAIPVGAFEPRDIMKSQHVNPSEAIQIHDDIKSKLSIGIHWGTFALADEGFLDGQEHLMDLVGCRSDKVQQIKNCYNGTKTLTEVIKESGIKINFVTLNFGQTYTV